MMSTLIDELERQDLSTGIVSLLSWDFGDGSTSSDQNPSHTYNDS